MIKKNEGGGSTELNGDTPEDLEITPISVDGRPFSEGGDWDTETARHLANEDFNARHRRRIEELGEKAATEDGIDTSNMSEAQKKDLIRSLGDKVFHDIAAKERVEEERENDDRKQKERDIQERERRIKKIEDNRPLNVAKKFFKQMFTGRER